MHGYNVDPKEAINAANRLQKGFDAIAGLPGTDYEKVRVIPFIWPSAGEVLKYDRDRYYAEASAPLAHRALKIFQQHQQGHGRDCTRRISVLAHSMGNYLLNHTLQDWVTEGGSKLFTNIFMVAPDIVDESFGPGELGEMVPHTSRRVLVYYADDDMALKTAIPINAFVSRRLSSRMGLTGPTEANMPRNVYTINADWVNTSRLGHSYYLPDYEVFKHIAHTLCEGYPDMDNGTKSFTLKEGYKFP